MLIGLFSSRLGAKRRLAIPFRFRTHLGKKFIIARWYEGSLVIVSMDNWQKLIKRVGSEGDFVTAPVRDTDRFIMAGAFEAEPDSQGRVVLPEFLANYAGLTNEVNFLGLGDRVEIWDKGKWEEREKYILKNAENLLEKLARRHGRE